MKPRVIFILTLCLFLSNCIILPANAAEVNINSQVRFQTIQGWGASSNFFEEDIARLPDSIRTAIFDLVYDDLGMNILCIRLYARFQTEEGGAYNWNLMAAQRMILTEALRRGNIDYIWVKVSSPPGWMKDNNDDAHGGHVLPEHYQDYADYLADYFIGMERNYGFQLDGLSIFNEPGFGDENVNYESTSTTPEEYRDILKVVHQTFQERGLEHVHFHGSESGHITGADGALSAYLPVIMADSVAAVALDVVQIHQYGDYRMLYGIGPADDWEGLRELADRHDKPVWESEIFVGGGQLGSQDIHEGLRAAQFIWAAMTMGNVEVWHYWQYAHPEDPNSSQGIIAYNSRRGTYAVRPRYHVLKQWVKHVPTGSTRIVAQSDEDSLFVAAYQSGDTTLTVIAFNLTSENIATTFIFSNSIYQVRHIRTSEGDDYAEQRVIEPNVDEFEVAMIPHSISTFVVSLEEQSVTQRLTPVTPQLLSAYPNPFNSSTLISFWKGDSAPATLLLSDISGRLVHIQSYGNLPPGNHSMTLDGCGLSPGLYHVRLKGATGRPLPVILIK